VTPGRTSAVVEIRHTNGLSGFSLRELVNHREVAAILAMRNLKLRYRQTVLGSAWALLQPLTAAAIFTLFFGHLAHVASDGLPYLAFALAGAVCWSYLSGAVGEAANSLVVDRALVTKVYFPRMLAPIAAILPGLVDLAVALVALVVVIVAEGVTPGIALLLTPLWILGLVAVALAVGLWLSALNARYRDVRYALPFATQLWLFVTPVIYPASYVSGDWRYLYAVNPAVGVFEGFRWSVLGGPVPGAEAFISLGSLLALLASATAYFQSVQREMADVI
jgi:lipopolysaccharide transport system permease protein